MLRRDIDFRKASSNNGTFRTHCVRRHDCHGGYEFVGALAAVRRVERWGNVDGKVGANVLVLSDNLALKVDNRPRRVGAALTPDEFVPRNAGATYAELECLDLARATKGSPGGAHTPSKA